MAYGATRNLKNRTIVADRADVREATVYAYDPLGGAHAPVDVSVILPVWNVGPVLSTTVAGCHAALAGLSYEIIVVDDGSTELHFDPVAASARLIRKRNGGKGSAIVAGTLEARGRIVAFLDGDGDIDPSHLTKMISLVAERERAGQSALVVGSKTAQGSQNQSSLRRKTLSTGFRIMQRALGATGVTDSQVGCKAATADVFHEAARSARQHGFLFDIELIHTARSLRAEVLEIPVTIRREGVSAVRLRTGLTMLVGLCAMAILRRCEDLL